MTRPMTVAALIAVSLVMLVSDRVAADTNSYVHKAYDFATLKTFDIKTQRRISSDPIADNQLWGDDIRAEIVKDLQANGFEREAGAPHPDFLVAFYVGLKEKYSVNVMDYGYPGIWGRRRFRGGWGWPNDIDVWRIPYTDSTLIVDIIDGQTNQLIWRGYDTNTIDMKQPDKRLDKAVDSLVKKFMKDKNAKAAR